AGTVESEKIENPSLIVIGDVVQFSSQLSWFEPELKDPALSEAL
ncbi:uroporphyrin-III C-methyltransferase, partial [Bacillus paralicheniformis]|nr:uroporphyrin-III C-methyltransferase [Bacillus paralicheniformis]